MVSGQSCHLSRDIEFDKSRSSRSQFQDGKGSSQAAFKEDSASYIQLAMTSMSL